ncbi:MAG: glycoside hydrolase family 28 protein [Candidatus Omnitrophica bacterium]|nr:glycoside hydrolase family 28 protein [Candidatus Omnitrophota bacterium]
MKNAALIGCFAFALILPIYVHADVYSVKDYGAIGDGRQSDQQAIQKAIDECARQGGGEILLPAGDYLSGELHLRSRVTLHLTAGATLWAGTNPADYAQGGRGRLLTADGADHIAVVGQGTIHGQGVADYGSRWGVPEAPSFRTGILLFEDCRHVAIRDVTILYSDSWTVHLKKCENVTIDGITILNNIRRLNSDGIDPNSCRNVHISNCRITAGDDCIVLKTTEEEACENIVVTNCTLETTTTAIKLGTESRGDFRDIHFSNCTIKNTRTGIGFFMKDGSLMERVTFSNISIETPRQHPYPMDVYPIFMDIEKRRAETPIGKIRDVIFQNIQIHSGSGILIQGMPESLIENLTLQNISLRAEWADDYSNRKKAVGGRRTYRDDRDVKYARLPSFLTLAHIDGLLVDNVQVAADSAAFQNPNRCAIQGWDARHGTLRCIGMNSPSDAAIRLHNSHDLLLCNSRVAEGTKRFLEVSGDKTRNIVLTGNNLRNAEQSILRHEEVSPAAIQEEIEK